MAEGKQAPLAVKWGQDSDFLDQGSMEIQQDKETK